MWLHQILFHYPKELAKNRHMPKKNPKNKKNPSPKQNLSKSKDYNSSEKSIYRLLKFKFINIKQSSELHYITWRYCKANVRSLQTPPRPRQKFSNFNGRRYMAGILPKRLKTQNNQSSMATHRMKLSQPNLYSFLNCNWSI